MKEECLDLDNVYMMDVSKVHTLLSLQKMMSSNIGEMKN